MPLPIRETALQRGDRARLKALVRLRTTAQRLVERTLHAAPPSGTHRSTRQMATATGQQPVTIISVDTSNPATDRHFKTGHQTGALRLG